LRKLSDEIVVSQPKYERALSATELAEAATSIFNNVGCEQTISHAIERALAMVKEDDIILITGSLFNVAEVKAFLTQIDASTS
jgi:folylpolyglutamate synthase/dihydropteroate synthase